MNYCLYPEVASDLGVFATTVSNAITDGTNTKQLNRFEFGKDCFSSTYNHVF